jgi:hypothetical protein
VSQPLLLLFLHLLLLLLLLCLLLQLLLRLHVLAPACHPCRGWQFEGGWHCSKPEVQLLLLLLLK